MPLLYLSSTRIVMALVVGYGTLLRWIDMEMAYLNGDLEEKIFMDIA